MPNKQHFETGHLIADVKGRSIRGSVLTVVVQSGKLILVFGSTAILARLLTPSDFGLMALVATFTGFVGIFKNLGLTMATVQREHITHEQVSALFWINIAFSLLLVLITALLAPALAWFYHEPRVTLITIVVAGTFIFGGLAAQHTALLRRQMQFTSLAIIEIASMAFSVLVAVSLAMHGAGYWALVAMISAEALATALLAWFFSGWRPSLPKRGANISSMVAFGGSLTGFNLLNYFSRNADNVVIGASLGASALGVYSKAYALLRLPLKQINRPITNIALSSLCRLQQDEKQYRSYFLKATSLLTFMTIPMVVFIFVDAEAVVLTLLGDQWVEAIAIFRILAIGSLIGTINFVPGWLCISLGRPKRQFIWACISAPILVIAFIYGVQWGIEGVAAMFSIVWSILFLALVVYACHDSPIRPSDIIKMTWRSLFASLGAGSIVFLFWDMTELYPPVLRLLIDAAIFGCAYLFLTFIIPGGKKFLVDTTQLFKHLKQRQT